MSRLQGTRRWRKKRGGGAEGGAPRPEVPEVRDLCNALDKIERSASLYPPGSGILRGFIDDVDNRLASLLERLQVVELSIGADEIEYEGEVVFDGTKLDRSIAFALEDGGVKRLVFREGLDRAEIVALVDALQEARKPGAEDLATLLWQRDLAHVSYIAVTFFSDLRVEQALERIDLEAAGRALVDRLRGRELAVDQVASVRGGRDTTDEAAEEDPLELFAIAPEEAAQIRRWIAECAEDSAAATVARAFLDLLSASAPEDVRRARLEALQALFAKLVEEGDVAAAAETIASVRRLAEGGAPHVSLSTRAHGPGNPLRAFVAAAASKEVGAKLGKLLARASDDDVAAIEQYVLVCGKHAFAMAADLLGTPHDARMLAALAEGCRGDHAFLREHTSDGNARVAAAAVRILAQVAGERAAEEFRQACGHKDPVVRREAVLALARCPDPKVFDRLLAALEDPAPEVRAAALRAAASAVARARPEQYDVVLKIVEDERRFDARPEPEQESFFVILGKLDPERGTAYLARLVGKFSLLRRARARRRRLQAIAALGEIATERAEGILRRAGEGARQDAVRAAVRAALDRLEVVRRSAAPAAAPPRRA
jgi:hypothetical protein